MMRSPHVALQRRREASEHPLNPSTAELQTILHLFVAFDWGDEIDVPHAARLVPGEMHAAPVRAGVSPPLQYHPAPLRFRVPGLSLNLPECESLNVDGVATVFDFGALSLAWNIPLYVSPGNLTALGGRLADPSGVIETARRALQPLFEQLRPAIRGAKWGDFSEEYFVFQFPAQPAIPSPGDTLAERADWLAGLVRLDPTPLSRGEVAEALRVMMSYRPQDLVLADWAAAVVFADNCDDVLEVIAFSNLQLLEYRQIDQQLDQHLQQAYRLIHRLTGAWLPFWRTHTRPLRALGKLNVDASQMFERTSNALKLIGDQYLARLYQSLAVRFHLEEWGTNIRRSLAVLEGIYQVLSSQSATYRAELLELTIVLLILVEILSPLFK
jgi:hypothetical protein